MKLECRFCAHLIAEEFHLPVVGEGFRCEKGRFDKNGPRHYFSWSGIWRPNKTVAAAQKECPFFTAHPRVRFVN